MSYKIQLLFVLLIVVIACNTESKNKVQSEIETEQNIKTDSFFTIDFAEIIKHKRDVYISEIAESVEYIPLENNQKSMLGSVMDVQLTADYILVKHNGSRLLTQFDREGKFVRHIGT